MGIPFPFQFIIFPFTFDFRRLFTPILKTAKRLLYLFADLRLGQLVSPLSGQPAINSVRWAPRFPILPAASGHAKRVVSSVAHNGPKLHDGVPLWWGIAVRRAVGRW